MLGCFFSSMSNNIKKKINFSSSIYIWFLFFLIIFTKFSTICANANTYKVVDLEISKPYDNNFNKESVVDLAFVKAFEQIILKITTLKKNQINNGINILDLVLLTKLGNSKGEVRRMIKNNGLKINNETISDENKIFYEDSFNRNNGMKVSHGKKQHVILKII